MSKEYVILVKPVVLTTEQEVKDYLFMLNEYKRVINWHSKDPRDFDSFIEC